MRYFGTSCPRTELAALPEVDRQGVKEGKARVGMTKRGVVLALGYPPPHATRSLDADRWIYWTNRMNRIAIVFRDGRVTGIAN
jgi:outer membrane protein assembly factor BamE (lipoprotein component of BamABCDE complex)